MTPPDANLNKQRRRHWPVIWIVAGAMVLAVIAWLAVSGFTQDGSDATAIDDAPAAPTEQTEDSGAE